MKIEVTVCDVGQEVGEPTTRYVVARDGEEIQLDLCEAHAEPLEELIGTRTARAAMPKTPKKTTEKKAPTKKPSKQAAPRRRKAKVVSMDEIEAMKKS